MEAKKRTGVWVVAETFKQVLHPICPELMGEGNRLSAALGEPLCAVLPGNGAEHLAEDLFDYGANRVICLEHPALEGFSPLVLQQALWELLREVQPRILIGGATLTGREVIPAVTAALDGILLKDCIRVDLDKQDKRLVAECPAYDGKRFSRYKIKKEGLQAVMLRQGTGSPAPYKKCKGYPKPEIFRPCFNKQEQGFFMVSKTAEKESKRLEEAKLVLAGGRGAKEGGLRLVSKLAELLGGVCGCTRPCVDAGWADYKQQIGQTGATVRPDWYLAFGISGAVQHVVGMKDSGTVVGINTDPQAEIFRYCDYGIKADAKRLLEALVELCR